MAGIATTSQLQRYMLKNDITFYFGLVWRPMLVFSYIIEEGLSIKKISIWLRLLVQKIILNIIKIKIYKRCDSNGFLIASQMLIKFGVCTSREYVSSMTSPPQTCSVLDSVMGFKKLGASSSQKKGSRRCIFMRSLMLPHYILTVKFVNTSVIVQGPLFGVSIFSMMLLIL